MKKTELTADRSDHARIKSLGQIARVLKINCNKE